MTNNKTRDEVMGIASSLQTMAALQLANLSIAERFNPQFQELATEIRREKVVPVGRIDHSPVEARKPLFERLRGTLDEVLVERGRLGITRDGQGAYRYPFQAEGTRMLPVQTLKEMGESIRALAVSQGRYEEAIRVRTSAAAEIHNQTSEVPRVERLENFRTATREEAKLYEDYRNRVVAHVAHLDSLSSRGFDVEVLKVMAKETKALDRWVHEVEMAEMTVNHLTPEQAAPVVKQKTPSMSM